MRYLRQQLHEFLHRHVPLGMPAMPV